jgi:ATP-dependent Clp protease ATP-binding subunit ClpE
MAKAVGIDLGSTNSVISARRPRWGKLGPVVGRDAETRRAIQIMSRMSKNVAVSFGDLGVGKTATVDGLSQHIAHGKPGVQLLTLETQRSSST